MAARARKTPATVEQWATGAKSGDKVVNGKHLTKEGRHRDKQAAARLARAMQLRWLDHLSYVEIGKLLETDEATVRGWLKPFAVIMENPAEVKAFKANEATLLDGIRFLAMKGMVAKLSDEAMVKKMDLSRLTYNFGVIYDKTRLERGESTTNVMTLSDLVKAAHATKVEPEEAEIVETKDTPPV